MTATGLLAAALPPVPSGLDILSAEGAFLACVAAILIDKMGIGGSKVTFITDRIAWVIWVAVFKVGFDGTGLTTLLVGLVTGVFTWLGTLWDAPLFRGGANIAPQALGAVVFLVALGAMLPTRASRWVGRFAAIQFAHLRQVGPGAAMSTTGVRPGTTAPARGGGIMKKVFSGQINYGLVGLALLLVTAATTVGGWVGQQIDWSVDTCVAATAWAVEPIVASITTGGVG